MRDGRPHETVLIIPAAGAGTRLGEPVPKVLSAVNGRAMVDYLFDRYQAVVTRFVLILHPSFERDVREHVERSVPKLEVAYALQRQATGMLDAILLAADVAAEGTPDRIWITWCDQIAVHPQTVATLARMSTEHPSAYAILPTVMQMPPYIHLQRDARGRIAGILQRREGDAMPSRGESDMGLFSLSPSAFFDALPEYGRIATPSAGTGERNFLPFLPWLVQRGHSVLTFPSTHELEAVGVNTPDDRRRLEDYLRDIERP